MFRKESCLTSTSAVMAAELVVRDNSGPSRRATLASRNTKFPLYLVALNIHDSSPKLRISRARVVPLSMDGRELRTGPLALDNCSASVVAGTKSASGMDPWPTS